MCIRDSSKNGVRALWLRAERGPIEDYGNAEEEVACGDFDSVEEFIEEWKAWFPDEIKWYQLQAVQLKDEGYRAVMLGHKDVYKRQVLLHTQSQDGGRRRTLPRRQYKRVQAQS